MENEIKQSEKENRKFADNVSVLAGHSQSQISKVSPSKLINQLHINDDTELDVIPVPKETMYLIDKVVRQKALQGPIGVDNSELIGLELEEEFKQKHQYMLGLAQRDGNAEDNSENMDEKLLARLMACANKHNES